MEKRTEEYGICTGRKHRLPQAGIYPRCFATVKGCTPPVILYNKDGKIW